MKKILVSLLLCVGCNNTEIPTLEKLIVPNIEENQVSEESDMIHISGKYCPKVEQICKTYKNNETGAFARCQEFYPTKCLSDKVDMDFYIDKEEFASDIGMPVTNISWTHAKRICEANNKRLCSDEEWTFACEGEEINAYSTGNTRPSDKCNMDIEKNVVCGNDLCDYRHNISEHQECKSIFGVHNMTANVDEWVEVPRYHHSSVKELTMRSALKGGHWLPVRNRCRPITKDHEEKVFAQISIGFRCCSNKINNNH